MHFPLLYNQVYSNYNEHHCPLPLLHIILLRHQTKHKSHVHLPFIKRNINRLALKNKKNKIEKIQWMSWSIQEVINMWCSYIRKENILLDRNKKHCEDRNKWYREEISKSWRSAISNRSVVLRSVARTNVLKRDVD